jgi:hypothetical protein
MELVLTFTYAGRRFDFPASVPPSRVPPADIIAFLQLMRPFIDAVIAIDPLEDRDLDATRLCFEAHFLSESPKERRPIWQTFDPYRTRSSYQVWFAFKLTAWLSDENERAFMGTRPTIDEPVEPEHRESSHIIEDTVYPW